MTDLKKGDIVTIGRKKDKYRVVHVNASSKGAVLIETIDTKPYAATYVNADQLTISKGKDKPGATPPPADAAFVLTFTKEDEDDFTHEVKAPTEADAVAQVSSVPYPVGYEYAGVAKVTD